jgi:hypothetical protein
MVTPTSKAAPPHPAKGEKSEAERLTGGTAYIVEMLTRTIEMAGDGKPDLQKILLGLAGKATATGDLAADESKSKGGKAAAFVASVSLTTLNLVELAGAGPGKVYATLGATLVKKVALSFNLVGDDDKRLAMMGAYADAAAQLIQVGAIVAFEAATPFGWTLAALNAAALVVACVKAYQAHEAVAAEDASSKRLP